ncbi:MAG: hypothetical protein NZ873_02675, partial [Crenarchaeota archaeon]|nr:hypothetical protein [Thermoproteota archaeon]MDW8034310.1 hypothetical protein [Nitrososphaerota archaeon]
SELLKVYEEFIKNVAEVLRKNGWMVFLAPSEMPVEDFIKSNGFKVMETYFIEVHSSLTRKLMVAKN